MAATQPRTQDHDREFQCSSRIFNKQLQDLPRLTTIAPQGAFIKPLIESVTTCGFGLKHEKNVLKDNRIL